MVNNRDCGIALIGFMGVGKTTIGNELSKRLDMELIDTDKFIQEKMNISVQEIFKKYGEKDFRQIEKDVIRELNKKRNLIISCGGGVCLNEENIENIRKNNKVILLKASSETILKRLENDRKRPLLNGKMNKEYIEKIIEDRKENYHRAADIIIHTDGKSVEEITGEIMEKLFLK